MTFSDAIQQFRATHKSTALLSKSLVTVDGKFVENIPIVNVNGAPNEEFYKWEFIHSLIASGLFSRDHIGTEVYFPKGNVASTPIKIDAVIFRSVTWLDHYRKYRRDRDADALEELRKMAIAVIEFKKDGKTIERVFTSQVVKSFFFCNFLHEPLA